MRMKRIRARINKVVSAALNMSLNRVICWAIKTLPLLLATDKNASHIILTPPPTIAVPSTKRNVPNITNPLNLMIDANARLAYPLAKRLEGRADGTLVQKGNRGDN